MKAVLKSMMILAILAISNGASAQSILDFKVVNKTGIIFYTLYVGASSSDSWGEDLLPSDVLGDEEEVEIKFTRGKVTDCKWDIYLDKDANGKSHTIVRDIDLCEVSVLTLKMNDQGKITYSTK